MEWEHAFQQSEYLAALQIFMAGALMAPGVLGSRDLYARFIAAGTAHVISFGPLALLVYVLYRVSQLS